MCVSYLRQETDNVLGQNQQQAWQRSSKRLGISLSKGLRRGSHARRAAVSRPNPRPIGQLRAAGEFCSRSPHHIYIYIYIYIYNIYIYIYMFWYTHYIYIYIYIHTSMYMYKMSHPVVELVTFEPWFVMSYSLTSNIENQRSEKEHQKSSTRSGALAIRNRPPQPRGSIDAQNGRAARRSALRQGSPRWVSAGAKTNMNNN